MSEINPFLPPKTETTFPGGSSSLVGNSLPENHAEILDGWRKSLIVDNQIDIDDEFTIGWLRRQFADERLIEGLLEHEKQSGVAVTEYIGHSYRYDRWHKEGAHFDDKYELDLKEKLGSVALGEHPLNVHADGRQRRHESGDLISINAVRKAGIDPRKVLFYRVTQPSFEPKPEFYWTSDSLEVRTGLRQELAGGAETAIVLVSTLQDISENGGLIDDINDDQGHAVRQAGLGSFNQQQALFTFRREI